MVAFKKTARQNRVKMLQDFIAKGEANRGYNSYNRFKSKNKLYRPSELDDIDFSKLSIKEVMAGQKKNILGNREYFAVGRYQLIPSTLAEAVRWGKKKGIVTDDSRFDEATQNKLFEYLIVKRKNLKKFVDGNKVDIDAVTQDLSMEWASFPNMKTYKYGKKLRKKGHSFYDDGVNKAHLTVEAVEGLLEDMQGATGDDFKPFPSEMLEGGPVDGAGIQNFDVNKYINDIMNFNEDTREDFITRNAVDIEEAADTLTEEEVKREESINVPTGREVGKEAPIDLDSMSFKGAFDTARSSGASTFSWKGKLFTTKVKGEKKEEEGKSKKKRKLGLSFGERMKVISTLTPESESLKEDIDTILNEDMERLIPEMDEDTPLLASTDEDFGDFIPKNRREPKVAEKGVDLEEEPTVVSEESEEGFEYPKGLPLDKLGGVEQKPLTNIEDDIKNITFEGMGTDIVNKFVDRNAIGFLTQGAIKHSVLDKGIDPTFDIEKDMDKELYNEMTEGLEAEDIEELLDSANTRGDFIKLASLMQGKLKRKKEMEKYAQEHPVFSGANSVGNLLVEGAAFMPLGTAIASAGQATKLRHLKALSATKVGRFVTAEMAEQGIQEIIWKVSDREYEFDPVMFATGVGAGVGLRAAVGAAESDALLRQLLKNEGGFINIATDEGKKLVDEVSKRVSDLKAIELADRITKKKIKVANEIRTDLEIKQASYTKRVEDLSQQLKEATDPKEIKSLKGKKQRAVRKLQKFEKTLPNQLTQLLKGTHPKLALKLNPKFSLTDVAKEIGIDPKLVNTPDRARKFLGLDAPDIRPDFTIEGDKAYKQVAAEQLREMSENTRLNMNEIFKRMAGTDTVRTLDELPLVGKLQLADKLKALADTDGPVSRLLFNKGNLVSSENELVSSYYNWFAPDGMGRYGTSKIRAIESQQKYANIYGGELMNMYHTHGTNIYEAMRGKYSKVRGMFSPDDYENLVEPILEERLLTKDGLAFRAKYGDEIGDAADKFYNDINKLNNGINIRAKEVGVEGVDFDTTDGWFSRDWDFREARGVDIDDLKNTITTAMLKHAENLGIKNIDGTKLIDQASKFAHGLHNADLGVIEGLTNDYIELLEKLVRKADDIEGGVITDEIARRKFLKAKHDAGDLANRVQLDVTQQLPDGRQLSDLFEQNFVHSQKKYISRMSARIAAAEHGIKNLNSLQDWIDDAVKLEVKRLAAKGIKDPVSKTKFIKQAMEQDLMSFKHGGMVGLNDLSDDGAHDMLRLTKKYNFARLMQHVGISSISEVGGTFVEAGVSTTMQQVGRQTKQYFSDLYSKDPDKYVDTLYNELRTIVGVGMEDFAFSTKGMSKATRIFEDGALNTFEKGVDVAGRMTQIPFGAMETLNRRGSVNALAIRWADHFMGREKDGIISSIFQSNKVTNRVLENSGFGKFNDLGEFELSDTYRAIKKNIEKFARFDDRGNLINFELHRWDNKTAHAFGDALQMQMNHIMVSPESTTMALWQSTWWGQVLNQFRTFTINATTKVMGHTLTNAAISANRGDMSETIKAGQKIFWGTSLGMLSVALRQGIQRTGGDREVDLFDDGMMKAAAIGFSRSSVAGNLPTLVDTIGSRFGVDPIFEKTSSFGRSKNFFNMATTPTGQAVGGVIKSGEKALQGDFKDSGMQLMKTSPLYRQIGVQQIFNFVDDEK